jgi:hypothetical protein
LAIAAGKDLGYGDEREVEEALADRARRRVCLWEFPERDHAAWQELTGDSAPWQEYVEFLAAAQAEKERQGHTVVRKQFSVTEMIERLEAAEFPNTPAARATITACYPDMPPATL